MRTTFVIAAFGLFIAPLAVQAQTTLAPGKYQGNINFLWSGRPMQEMVTLTVDKVEGDRFEGVAWVGIKLCRVDTPVHGQIDGDSVKVTGKGVKDNCGIRWDLKLDGNKLEGTASGGNKLVLSR